MTKRYIHLRLTQEAHRELKKFKNLYELQDEKDYSFSDIIFRLTGDRSTKQFKLPIMDKKE